MHGGVAVTLGWNFVSINKNKVMVGRWACKHETYPHILVVSKSISTMITFYSNFNMNAQTPTVITLSVCCSQKHQTACSSWQRKSLYCKYLGVSKQFLVPQHVPSNWNIFLYGIYMVLQVQSANYHTDFLVQWANNLSFPQQEVRPLKQDLTSCHQPTAG